MEVTRLGVQWELQLPTYTTAAATQDPSQVFFLHHSSQQCQILNPLSKTRDRTCILTDTSRVLNPLNHNGNSRILPVLQDYCFFFLCLFVCLLCVFLGLHSWYMEVPRLGVNWSYSFWPIPQPQHQI